MRNCAEESESDNAAFEMLVERHQARAFRLASSILANEADAAMYHRRHSSGSMKRPIGSTVVRAFPPGFIASSSIFVLIISAVIDGGAKLYPWLGHWTTLKYRWSIRRRTSPVLNWRQFEIKRVSSSTRRLSSCRRINGLPFCCRCRKIFRAVKSRPSLNVLKPLRASIFIGAWLN
jgi:hypothetical protein